MFEDALEIFEGVKKGRLARKRMYQEGTSIKCSKRW
jgi:hypothetical protein